MAGLIRKSVTSETSRDSIPIIPACDLRYVRGIGPKRAEMLAKLQIRTIHDLLYHFPSRYEDRTLFSKIKDLQPGQTVSVEVEIISARLKPIPRMPMVEMTAGDDTGLISVVWHRQTYLLKQLLPEKLAILYGKVEKDGAKIKISNPEIEFVDSAAPGIHTGRIVPVYGLTEGLHQKSLRALIYGLTQSEKIGELIDHLPESIRKSESFVSLRDAIRGIHFPESEPHLESSKRRLIFDEFFSFQLSLQSQIRKNHMRQDGVAANAASGTLEDYAASLPYELTEDQHRAMTEIEVDCRGIRPMNRLLQGDVGSGKTAVAAFGFLLMKRSGLQSAFLVPTEILAEQHYQTLKKLLAPFKLEIALLTKSTEKKRRERLLAELRQGKVDLVVGTHALLQDEVDFKKLGLVVVDEQHKFGVVQRSRLLERKPVPHCLVMTATPIPRSLALAVYADADFSTIRQLPKGRQPISTYWISRQKQPEVWEHIKLNLKKGRQAYVVFPIIEESSKADLKAAETEFKKLKGSYFSEFKLALVHGKTPQEQRESSMRLFYEGKVDVLVSTTVIEVGVDQPNATMMVIENAERFGLAQLHQLRGRIGRGEHASECFLFGEPTTDEGKLRLRLLTKTQDGFQIAEEDLNLRGPGDLWGERQSGIPHFKLAHPIWNLDLLQRAKELAAAVVKESAEQIWIKKYLAERLRNY